MKGNEGDEADENEDVEKGSWRVKIKESERERKSTESILLIRFVVRYRPRAVESGFRNVVSTDGRKLKYGYFKVCLMLNCVVKY